MKVQTEDGPQTIEVHGLDRQEYRALLDAHPPRADDTAPWNDDTFPPALIAACTDVTLRGAREAWEEWPQGDAEALLIECLRAAMPGSLEWAHDLLRRNTRRALEVRAATSAGIPTSQFLTWPKDDQDLALAYLENESDRCSCGVPIKDGKKVGRYRADFRQCEVCKLLEGAREQISDEARAYTHIELVAIDRSAP